MPDAKAAAQRALAINDAIAEAHTSLGFVYLVYDWVVELSNRLPWMVAALAVGYAEAGRTEEARRLLEELRARAGREYVRALHLAEVWAALGETEEALVWLEKAYEERDVTLPLLREGGHLPATSLMAFPVSLRSDPRYRALLRKVGLE